MVDNIIKIFDSGATSFTTLGLGVLSDAVSCIVTEERNGAFELEMEYPISGSHFKDIAIRNIIVATPNMHSQGQPFRIYAISKPINGIVLVNAEHISYDLLGYSASVLKTTQAVAGPAGYFAALPNLIVPSGCPFTFGTNITSNKEFRIKDVVPVKKALGGMEGSVLDTFHGEYEWDGYSVYLYSTATTSGTDGDDDYTESPTRGRGMDRGVSIRYGKNMTDFKQETNNQNFYTGVYPFWHYEEYRHDMYELPEKIVYAEGFSDSSPYNKILPLDTTDYFMRRPEESKLREYAQKYIKSNKIGDPSVGVSYDISFIPLEQTEDYKNFQQLETVHLCDTIHIFYPDYGINTTAKVTKTEYSVLSGKYRSISLGFFKAGVSDTIATQTIKVEEKVSTTILESAIADATSLLTGAEGGHVLYGSYNSETRELSLDQSSPPQEIFVLANEDLDARSGVWRWNMNGLGYSPTGIDGPYTTAITSDGEIDANFIKLGKLDAGVIEAGSITADKISVDYTNQISQAFTLADGQLKSEIKEITDVLAANVAAGQYSISTLEQNYDSLLASFQSIAVGGNNKIQNSSGLLGLTREWETSGTYVATLQDADEQENTSSGSAFVINNGTMSQTIGSMTIGNSYYFGLKAKVTTSAACSVTLTDGEAETVVMSSSGSTSGWRDYYIIFTASTHEVTITATSAGDRLLVADMMLSEGNTKHDWSPYPNEIYTTNVKIDKTGINITNSESNTQTLIDNTQFAVKHNGETVLTVNKDLTTLQKTNIVDELTIGSNAKIVPVSGGIDLVILV